MAGNGRISLVLFVEKSGRDYQTSSHFVQMHTSCKHTFKYQIILTEGVLLSAETFVTLLTFMRASWILTIGGKKNQRPLYQHK